MAEPTSPARGNLSSRNESTSLTLMEKMRQNDPDAWNRLEYQFGPLIDYWSRRRGVPDAARADIRQSVFLVVFQKRSEFRKSGPEDTFRGWLCRITHNVLHEWCRANRNSPAGEGGTDAARRLDELPAPAAVDDVPESEEAALMHRTLRLIAAMLTPRELEIAQLSFIEGLSGPEVAVRLSMTPENVRVKVCRLKKRVRQALGEDGTGLEPRD